MCCKKGHFIGGIILGALLGGVLGLLFAPFSGETARQKIKELSENKDDLIQDTKDKTETLIHKTKEAIENGFEKISTMIQEKHSK